MNTLNYKNDNSLFSNSFGFLRFPLEFDPYNSNSDWVITGVPFDMATSGRSGSRFGPTAIRQASINLAWEHFRWPWSVNIRENLHVVDCGDLIYKSGDIQDFTSSLQNHAENLLMSGKKMLSFGGDHYITLPILRAYAKFFEKIAIIHFDAHADYYNNDSKYDHGVVILHALNEKLIDPVHSIQIGIRTEYKKCFGFTVLDVEYVNDTNIDIIINKITSIAQSFPVYLTFDIDCLDPSIAPGTGTPVIGGLTSYRVLKLIRGFQHLNIIGIDLVEVAPAYDCAQITALAAATIGLEMLYTQVKSKKN
ncbi:agmatinase [Blochmannia endosymbiont of Camponotus modoc]|uniref:agmatinase n=1 Tax=Blochmannia endosymbiont of Camponotus modoc TaxID=2945587 RepID=UPI002024DC30|nr:agmatinase [Blochmannia endosymbiont of Camponotus modoc]URJ26521.1 agmatinase [Blochmannia endosymbiont of Camponotus modoc]URJ32000.1 agmatinase [Blochmannia endosymbiont of Camponotus modoc]